MNEYEKKLIETSERAVKAGGTILKQKRYKKLEIIGKKDGDIATSFDFETEAAIKSILRANYPESQICAEESGIESCSDESNIIWYVDSLDGTKAFLRGNIAFVSISVASIDHEGEPISGVIYNPFTKILYSVARSNIVGLVNNQEIIQVTRPPLNEARVLLDFSSDHPIELKRELLLAETKNVGRVFRYGGSIAQHLCFVAQGILDAAVFWGTGEKGAYWDIAAAQLLCEKSNLLVTDFQGKRIDSKSPVFDQFIVGSEELHKELLEWVNDLKRKFSV